MPATLSKGQLKRLQVLYSQYAARDLMAPNTREERLRWASQQLARSVSSFSDLDTREAKSLIDQLQGFLGIKETRRPRRMSRRDAEKAATEGRYDQKHSEQTLASAEDFARIRHGMDLLGWDQARLDAWLRSASSPLARKVNGVRMASAEPAIRTLGQANRVWWALKGMARAQGKWRPIDGR
jgi:hypothetical protein